MRNKEIMKSLCLYDNVMTPSHEYQAEAINAECIDYRNISSIASNFHADLALSIGFRPLLISSLLKSSHIIKYHINILMGDFIPSIRNKNVYKRHC